MVKMLFLLCQYTSASSQQHCQRFSVQKEEEEEEEKSHVDMTPKSTSDEKDDRYGW